MDDAHDNNNDSEKNNTSSDGEDHVISLESLID
jgi:hypothetical protein